jgi:hypothetical protein
MKERATGDNACSVLTIANRVLTVNTCTKIAAFNYFLMKTGVKLRESFQSEG